MLKNLLRPKWQHPDPEIRAKALAQGGVDLEVAVELAVNDSELRVRRLAVAAIEEIGALVALDGRCPELRAEIAAALHPLLLPRDAGAGLRDRELEIAVELLSAQQRLELLREAGSVRLRVLALRWVSDPTALRERALGDDDIHVRKAAIERIDCPETLGEIARLSQKLSASLVELAEQRARIVLDLQERTARRQAVLSALQDMLEGNKPLTEPAWEKQRAAWKELEKDARTAECEAFDRSIAALAPLLEEQRQRRAADKLRQDQREQILEQLLQVGRQIEEHELDQSQIAIDMLERAWSELEPMHDHWTERRLQQQFVEALAQLRQQFEQQRLLRAQSRIFAPALERLEQILARPRLRDKDVGEARKQVEAVTARLRDKTSLLEERQRLHRLSDRISLRLKEQKGQDQQRIEALKDQVGAFETALNAQELQPALAAHQAAQALLKEYGDSPPPAARELERRLHRSDAELRRLRSWANWGSDHARQELIDEAVALQSAQLRVDTLGKRIKQLRERWKALGKLGPGGKAQWLEFDAACTKAYEPVKAHRDSEQQQRKVHLQEREDLCAEIEALTESTDWSQPDWRALDNALNQFRKRWRESGAVPHKSWKRVLGRFEQAMDALSAQLEPERRKNFLQRQALVREAEQLAEQEDARAAVAAAKELRGRWQLTVSSHPKQERELWGQFSKAMDSIFGKDRAERDQFKAELNDHLNQGEVLCKQLEDLAGMEMHRLGEQRGRIAQVEEAFRALGEVPKQARRGLEQRFKKARDKVSEQMRSAKAQRREQQTERLFQRHQVCTRMEQAALAGGVESGLIDALCDQWSAIAGDDTESATERALQQRWDRAQAVARQEQGLDSLGELDANLAARQRICLDLEILLGQDSPAEARAERMARQVEMLQAAMSGGDDDRGAQVRRLKLDYLQTGAVATASDTDQRFARLFPLSKTDSN